MENERRAFSPNAASLAAILLGSMIILMGAAAVAPALKPIAEHFGIDDKFVQSLVVSLPSLSCAITGFGMGWIADRIGKTKTLIISLVIFTATGTLGFVAPDYTVLLVCRFLLGIGITGISLTTTALIGEYYFGMQRAKVIGYQAAAIGVGTLVLETAGGSLTDVGWNYPFLIYLIGVPVLIFALIGIRDVGPRQPAADAGEAAPAEDRPVQWGKVLFCYIMVFLEMLMMFSMPMNFSDYISGMELDYLWVGIYLGAMGVCQAVFSILYARRVNKLSDMSAYAASFAMMAVGLGLLCTENMAAIMVSMVFVGFSLGLLMPTVIAQLSILSTATTAGKVMGGYSVFLNLANFVSSIVFAMILTAVDQDFDVMFAVAAVCCAVVCAGLAVKFVAARGRKAAEAPAPAATKMPLDQVGEGPSMYGSILVATDGSPNSYQAIANAVNVARKNSARLTVVYVIDPEAVSSLAGTLDTSENIMDAAKSISADAFALAGDLSAKSGVQLETKILRGRAWEAIVNESADYDLVVCGSLGRTDARRALIGSVAERVVRYAHCPVLVCRDSGKE